MEEQLRDLVIKNGFEAVFTTLKVLVTGEYERAKRDFNFLQTLIVKPAEVPKKAEEETKKEEEETKTIEVTQPVKLAKKLIRKQKQAE